MEPARAPSLPLHSNTDVNTILPYYRFPGECPLPLRYPYLESDEIDKRLARVANAAEPIPGTAWSLSFQPSLDENDPSQDRFVVERWNDRWLFAAVFDGHAGVDTAEHAFRTLPELVKQSLLQLAEGDELSSSTVADMLSQQIQTYDAELAAALMAIFPEDKLKDMSDEELDKLVNDHLYGGTGEIHQTVLRCMRGTTAVVLLVDTRTGDMWTAGLGDSEAVLASRVAGKPTCTRLTDYHNGTDPKEIELIKAAHPGEEATCIARSRVLGAIAVTRALGDHAFKLPAIYTERVFLRAREPGFASPAKVEQFLVHIRTPPYLSAQPDVRYHQIRPEDEYVMLCSDGLRDLWDYEGRSNAEEDWATCLLGRDGHENPALRVLRLGLGGADTEKCSMLMGLQLEGKWMDDTTIVVISLH